MLGDLGKLIVAKGFKKLPKVQKIARSGHTGIKVTCFTRFLIDTDSYLAFSVIQYFIKL